MIYTILITKIVLGRAKVYEDGLETGLEKTNFNLLKHHFQPFSRQFSTILQACTKLVVPEVLATIGWHQPPSRCIWGGGRAWAAASSPAGWGC